MNATAAKIPFSTRQVGQTGLEITTLGLGGATLAGMMANVPEEQARARLGLTPSGKDEQ